MKDNTNVNDLENKASYDVIRLNGFTQKLTRSEHMQVTVTRE